MAEFGVHFVMLMILLGLIAKLWACLRSGRENFQSPWASTDDKIHLIDHLLGVSLSMIGAMFTTAALFIELLSHVIGEPAQLHFLIHIGLCVTLTGAVYIAWHLEKEEDPTHPFYHWLGKRKTRRGPRISPQ